MLGTTLPKGSETIAYHNTLFRVSELCWIKAVRLSIPEVVVRVVALVLSVAWVMVMKNAKQTYMNAEFLLAAFPLLLAWSTSGSLKIGCSGDFEEAYDSRRGMMTSVFTGWIETLRKKEPDWLHLKSSNYDLLLNPHRVAWIRPCLQWKVFPLFVLAVFAGYLALVNLKLDFETYPIFDEFQILIFHGGVGTVRTVSYLIIAASVAAFFLSIKRSVEVCGTGGVQDVFPLTAADQACVLNVLSGSKADSASPESRAPKKKTSEPTVASKPAAKKEQVVASVAPVKPAAAEPAVATKSAETPTRALSEDMNLAGGSPASASAPRSES